MSKIVAETASIVNNLMEGPHFGGGGGGALHGLSNFTSNIIEQLMSPCLTGSCIQLRPQHSCTCFWCF